MPASLTRADRTAGCKGELVVRDRSAKAKASARTEDGCRIID